MDRAEFDAAIAELHTAESSVISRAALLREWRAKWLPAGGNLLSLYLRAHELHESGQTALRYSPESESIRQSVTAYGWLLDAIRKHADDPESPIPTLHASPISQVEIDFSMFPASHYKGKYGLEPNTLRKAQMDGRLDGKKRKGRWFYPMPQVRSLWPDLFTT